VDHARCVIATLVDAALPQLGAGSAAQPGISDSRLPPSGQVAYGGKYGFTAVRRRAAAISVLEEANSLACWMLRGNEFSLYREVHHVPV